MGECVSPGNSTLGDFGAQETLHKVIAGQKTTLADFGAMNLNLR